MVKILLGEAFEQLGEIPSQTIRQVVKLPADVVKTSIAQVTGASGQKIDPLTGIEIPSQKKIAQLKKKEAKTKKVAFSYARQIIYGSQKPLPAEALAKAGQIPQYVSEKKKPSLPPPISASKPKMGTSERRPGVSG